MSVRRRLTRGPIEQTFAATYPARDTLRARALACQAQGMWPQLSSGMVLVFDYWESILSDRLTILM